ncbi:MULTISPECIES: integrase [unclassified Streptomyces]|uniref:integrase n=1 Tax=unclassified Streptomyces TaxID=2593676 RepID=UPI000DDB68E2|nr:MULTISPECIES: integrase [unclassified Streptomyces]QZZ26587.1 integrase [Streptomyces sp. ST1015]
MPYAEPRGNKWRVRWNTGKKNPETGKWLYDGQGGFDDRDAAIAYGLDREADIRNQRYVSRRDGTLLMSEYCKVWPQSLDVGHLRKRNIKSMIRLYIEPHWGDWAIGDIRASSHKAWELWLKGQPNVGDDYRKSIMLVFSMMMDDAVEDELRASSPVKKRNRRRGKYKKAKKKERKRNMRMEDVFQLACNALVFWGFQGFVYELMMPFAGNRPAELYALRREYSYPAWPASDPLDDEEEEDREERHAEDMERYGNGDDLMPAIRVQWQHQRENGVLALHPPKYGSRRTLVLPPFLAELMAMLLGSHESEWAFLGITGGLLANANVSFYYWRPIADGRPASEKFERDRQGTKHMSDSRRPLPEIPSVARWAGKRQYLKRHGHKEWMDEDGHSRIAVETRMGHEVAGVEGLYANVTPAMERRIMETLQLRWQQFVATLPEDWEFPPSPSPLPVDLNGWMKLQIKAAKALGF